MQVGGDVIDVAKDLHPTLLDFVRIAVGKFLAPRAVSDRHDSQGRNLRRCGQRAGKEHVVTLFRPEPRHHADYEILCGKPETFACLSSLQWRGRHKRSLIDSIVDPDESGS